MGALLDGNLTVDLQPFLAERARQRPIPHSDADFQHCCRPVIDTFVSTNIAAKGVEDEQ